MLLESSQLSVLVHTGAIALGGVFPIGNGSGLTFLECSGSEGGLNCNERCKDGCSDAGVKCLHTGQI